MVTCGEHAEDAVGEEPGDVGWDAQLEAATAACRTWFETFSDVVAVALRNTLTHDEVDLAEGLRHLARMVRLTTFSGFENNDGGDPYLWRALGPDLKMGGDNPQGLYISAPINGIDTFRLSGTRGSAIWVSVIIGRGASARAAGLAPFGEAVFSTELEIADDGTFELYAPRERPRVSPTGCPPTSTATVCSCASSSAPTRRSPRWTCASRT
ncbi:MAG: hypothetical protein U0W40_12935 [Acidimicrobiia bacterium]